MLAERSTRTMSDRRFLVDTASVGSLTTIVKLAGAAKIVVSARFFGASSELDAYLIAFLAPSFLADILAGSLNPAFIPVLVEVRETQGRDEANALYAATLRRTALLLALAALVLAILAMPVLHILASGFPPAKLNLTRALLFGMIPVLPLSGIGMVWRSVLNAEEHFAMAAISPAMTPLVTIVSLLVAGRQWGIYALAAGTTLGCAAELVFLAAALRLHALPILPRGAGGGRGGDALHRVGHQYGPILASNLVIGGSTVVDQVMAAMLGPGSVSILSFGTRLSTVLLAIGPAALSTAVLPRFSRMAALKDWTGLRRSVKTYLLAGMLAAIPVTALLVGFSEPIARLLYQRGAFTAADTHVVAGVQACSLLQLPFSIGVAILVRLIASLKASRMLLGVSAAALVLNAALDYVLMRRLGVAGIAISTVVVHGVILAVLTLLVSRRLPR